MSTRATYQFKDGPDTLVTYYIHHDGYPAGAAEYYMIPALECFNATGFFRKNERAEVTWGHEAHGDTQFRYTINGEDVDATVTVSERPLSTGVWDPIFEGTLIEFLEKYAETEVKKVKLGYRERYTTKASLENLVEKATAEYEEYKANHPTMLGNLGSFRDERDAAVAALDGF